MITQAHIDEVTAQLRGKHPRLDIDEVMSYALGICAEQGIYTPAFLHRVAQIGVKREYSGKNLGTRGHQGRVERRLRYEAMTEHVRVGGEKIQLAPNDHGTFLVKTRDRTTAWKRDKYRNDPEYRERKKEAQRAYRERMKAA